MTIWLDIIKRADGGYLIKAPMFPAWKFESDTYDECRAKAMASLWRHMRKHVTVSWNGAWE